MKKPKLARANGIIGIVGGALLIIFTMIFWSLVAQHHIPQQPIILMMLAIS